MNKTNSQKMNSSQLLPKTYLELIEKVGSKGTYQYIYLSIQAFSYYVAGIILMSNAFLFNNPSFDCQTYGLLAADCYATVCSLPSNQWASFVTPQGNNFKSLANSFRSYYCDDQIYLNLYSSAPYLGTMFGCFIIAIVADNYGRRRALLCGSWLTVIGCIILILANQLWVASIGLVLCGMGADSMYITFLSLAAECVQDHFRQKMSAIVQAAFIVGALFVTLIYYLYQNWLISTIYCLAIPAIIGALAITFIIKESPVYLMINSPEKALKEINQIGWINKKQKNILRMQDIQNVLKYQQTMKYNKASSPVDVFKYPSLRIISIAQLLIGMSTFIMYYGPTLIVDQFGFDIYTSQTAINIADLLTYYPLMLIIDKVKRRKCAIILFGVATIISILLIFITKPVTCDFCPIVFIQLALVFVFRFAISMEFALMLIYQTELYPIRVRNIASGVLLTFGTASSAVAPIIMGILVRNQLNPFILFTVLGLIGMGSYVFCPETFGKLCPQQIEEIQHQKNKKLLGELSYQDERLHQY